MSAFPRTLRRLVLACAALAMTSSAVIAAATPAQAAPPGCHGPAKGYNIDGNQNIHAHHFWVCDDGNDILLGVSIQRYVSPGVWTIVSSGTGFTTYTCNGHGLNIYRTTGTAQFYNTCG